MKRLAHGPIGLLAAAALLSLLVVAPPARAQDAANGFVVRHQIAVDAPPSEVWEALVDGVGSWWSSEHTFSRDAANLTIDARPGGCFCERFPEGGGVEHMRVVYVAAPTKLRLVGALGPLQGSGLAGSLTLELTADPEGGTTVALTYSVGGYMEGGFDSIAPAVGGVLGEQLDRFGRFLETGSPENVAGAMDSP